MANAYAIILAASSQGNTRTNKVSRQTQMQKAATEHLDTLLPKAKEIENVGNMSARGAGSRPCRTKGRTFSKTFALVY